MHARIPSQRDRDLRLQGPNRRFVMMGVAEFVLLVTLLFILLFPITLFVSVRYLAPNWDRISAVIQQNDYVIAAIYVVCFIVSVALVLVLRNVLMWVAVRRIILAQLDLRYAEDDLDTSPQA